MRIRVAVIALSKRQPAIAWRAIGSGRVTLLAFHLLVQTGERITRLRVIELARRIFPVDEVVTLQTFLPESSFVEVLVTGHARLGYAQEGLAEILLLYRGSLGRWYAFRKVALVAGQPRVFAFEKVAGFLVIELIRIPFDEREIRAVVVGVTAHALLAGACRNVIRAMQPALLRHPRADIRVTADAFELRLAATELVAFRTVNGSVEELVLTREWAGRNLRRRACGQQRQQKP